MIILLIFTIIIILIIMFFFINLKIEIDNLKIVLPKCKDKIFNTDSKFLLTIYILDKFKIVELNLKTINLKNKKVKNIIKKQFEGNKLNLDTIEFLKNISYIIEKLKLKISIGTEDAAITAIGIGLGYTFISILLKNRIKNIKNIEYDILPIYENKNILKIELDSIISLKMENIINIVKYFRNGRVNKDDRTSNRKSYAYSNE